MSEVDRLSQGPSQVRKGVRAPPSYRNDANFGRASGKIINIGNVARDSDGFEDFGAYLNDDVFLSPPPSIPSRPKPKNPKKSTTNARRTTDYDDDLSILDDSVLRRRAEPELPKKSSQTRPLPVTTATSTSRQNRPATQPTSAVDYASIPEPSTKRKALGQSTSSKASSSSSHTRPTTGKPRPSQQTSTSSRPVSAPAKSTGKGKQAAALSTIAEDESDDMDEQDGNGDSNMSMASVVDRNQGAESYAGRFNQDDDDDSGNEDLGYNGDDNDGGMDLDEPEQDPIPEPPRSKANDKARRNRVETPSDEEMAESAIGRDDDDVPAPDEDDQFDVGGGYDDDPQQEEEEEEPEPEESPRSKRARLAQEKKDKEKEKAQQKREPLRQKDPNAQPKKTKRNFEPQSDDDDDTGLRRGKRQRYAPLQWWRGEHAVVRRPRPDEAPVPIISEIVRIPEAQPEPLSKKHRRRGTTKPPSSRNGRNNSKQAEVWVENPDEGWDAETEQNALVIDYDTKQEMEKVIAQTAAMLNPKQPLNATYAFQKVFSDGEFVAGGVLEIPVGGKKPSKPARDNTYLFYCIEGAVRVMVHRSTFVIARNGMFMVPRGNQYYLENISDHDCKLFFAQARKVTEKMIPSPTKRASMPAGRDTSASQTPRPAARVGPPAGSGSPSKPKKIGTSSKR